MAHYDNHMVNFRADRAIERNPRLIGKALSHAVRETQEVRVLLGKVFLRRSDKLRLAEIQKAYL